MSATLQEELSERVRRDGFAVVRGVLDEQALSSFEESLEAVESGEGVLRAGQRLNVSVSSRRGAAVLYLYREGAEGLAPLLYGKRKAAYVPLSVGKYRIRVRSRSGEVGYVLRAELK